MSNLTGTTTTALSDISSDDETENEMSVSDLTEIIETLENLNLNRKIPPKNKTEQVVELSALISKGISSYEASYKDSDGKNALQNVAIEICDAICGNVKASPNDIFNLAKNRHGSELTNAIVFYHVAALYFAKGESVQSFLKITECVQGVANIAKENGRSPMTTNAITAMVLMCEIIAKMNVVNLEKKTLKVHSCLKFIMSCKPLENEWKELRDLTLNMIEEIEDFYKNEADHFRIYGLCLHDMGHITSNMSNPKESLSYFEKALQARKNATDYKNSDHRIKRIKETEENLKVARGRLNAKNK